MTSFVIWSIAVVIVIAACMASHKHAVDCEARGGRVTHAYRSQMCLSSDGRVLDTWGW